MISLEDKLEFLNGRACLGCGCEVEAKAFYKRNEKPVGYLDSCGVMVVDNIVIGFGSPD